MIKAVLLDVDNTLLDFNLSAKATIKTAFSEMGIEYSDGIFDTFLRVNDKLWRRIERKEITREKLHEIRWEIIFDELGITADGKKMEGLFLRHLEDFAIPVEGALDIVRYLADKYKLYTASNAPYAQQIKRLTISGIMPYVSGILNFEAQGVHKPQKQFFEQCLNAMRPFGKDEITLIGDSLSADMQGGKSVGFNTIWFNHDGIKITPPETCDYVVRALGEIKNIL